MRELINLNPNSYIERQADLETQERYLQPLEWLLNINLRKEKKNMVDLNKIQNDIEALKSLSAEEYCAEEVRKIYADFEASRAKKIEELEVALRIYEAYKIVEEPSVQEDVENVEHAEEL